MTFVPRYNLIPMTEITLLQRPMVVTGTTDDGYLVRGTEDGVTSVLSFVQLVEYLKMPGARIDARDPGSETSSVLRLGGFRTAESLSEEQRELGRLNVAVVHAAFAFREIKRREDPDYQLSIRKLDESAVRKFIATAASATLGKPVRVKARGSQDKNLFVPSGRRIMEFVRIFESLPPGERALEAMVPLYHLRGNRTPRICHDLRDLMTRAWEEIGIDLKSPATARVHEFLDAIIKEENKTRTLNDLPELVVPSRKSVLRHLHDHLTPTEIMVGTKGPRYAQNKRGRGSTDIRALMIGELVMMDECKMSVVAAVKKQGFWHVLSDDAKAAYEALDEEVRKRLHILVLLDVASRKALAWVITENPGAEATLALLRMATRDKTREKIMYGCEGTPAAAVGLMHMRHDNGPGLRNTMVLGAMMGMGAIDTHNRAYHSTDNSPKERNFGTLESRLFRLLPGYTGRKPGDLPGYDAIKNGVLDLEILFGMVTRYFIDEYPSCRHYGVGMGGRRPAEVYRHINETRGHVPCMDPNLRRIHLGWEMEATPNDEGVRVFSAIWFNSNALQELTDTPEGRGKVRVFVDPENLNLATVVVPGHKEPVEVELQTSVFADMTVPEVLQLMLEYRKEDPHTTEIHEDRLARLRLARHAQIKSIGVEHNLPRSYSTFEECRTLAKAVFAGSRILGGRTLEGTVQHAAITSEEVSEGIYALGEDRVIEGFAVAVDEPEDHLAEPDAFEGDVDSVAEDAAPAKASVDPEKAATARPRKQGAAIDRFTFARPKNLKVLE